jgi:Flp pilus assembly pilin Flp
VLHRFKRRGAIVVRIPKSEHGAKVVEVALITALISAAAFVAVLSLQAG